MTEDECKVILEASGLPVVYHHWISPPALPYIVFVRTQSDNYKADGTVYAKDNVFNAELYSDKKDPEAEQKLESALDQGEIFYEVVSEDYIETEDMYQVIYEI